MKYFNLLPQHILIIIMIIPMLACVPSISQVTPTPTKTPKRASTLTPLDTATPTPAVIAVSATQGESSTQNGESQTTSTDTAATVEPSPTPTPEPPTATPTEEPVTITLLQKMNVRGGPGTNYPVIGSGSAGESTRVLGRNDDSSWLQIEYASNDGTGWIFASLVQVNGNAETVAVAGAPPPPPPTNTPVPPPTAVPPTPVPAPPAPPADAKTQVIIEMPKGDTYDAGDKIKIKFTVKDPDGVWSFTWGVFLQNLTPLIGGEVVCHNAPECKHEVEEHAPAITGAYIVGADVVDSKGNASREISALYVR